MNTPITYLQSPILQNIRVYQANRRIGTIMPDVDGKGYFYQPVGSAKKYRGETMPSVQAVKRSLES